MFEFLGMSEIVHIVNEFMHKWHGLDEKDKAQRKRAQAGFDVRAQEFRKRRAVVQKAKFEAAAGEEDEARVRTRTYEKKAGEQETRAAAPRLSPTVAQISEGTGLSHGQIREALKSAEDQFVHWPEPGQPDMARYALREQVEQHGMQGYQPGVGM